MQWERVQDLTRATAIPLTMKTDESGARGTTPDRCLFLGHRIQWLHGHRIGGQAVLPRGVAGIYR